MHCITGRLGPGYIRKSPISACWSGFFVIAPEEFVILNCRIVEFATLIFPALILEESIIIRFRGKLLRLLQAALFLLAPTPLFVSNQAQSSLT
jgi:hypothetical protein